MRRQTRWGAVHDGHPRAWDVGYPPSGPRRHRLDLDLPAVWRVKFNTRRGRYCESRPSERPRRCASAEALPIADKWLRAVGAQCLAIEIPRRPISAGSQRG